MPLVYNVSLFFWLLGFLCAFEAIVTFDKKSFQKRVFQQPKRDLHA